MFEACIIRKRGRGGERGRESKTVRNAVSVVITVQSRHVSTSHEVVISYAKSQGYSAVLLVALFVYFQHPHG